jgi:putative ABC transport system permease protein
VIGERVYRLLLRLYPAAFRDRYGAAMEDVFARDWARARVAGPGAVVSFWTRTTIEAFAYGPAARLTPAGGARLARGPLMTFSLLTDLRDANRALRATPLVTVVAILSLAFGIGANTALFSILNALVLKPLPVHAPESLAFLDKGDWTNPIWEEIRARQHDLFDGAFAWSLTRFNLAEHGPTDTVVGAYASGGMFGLLGIAPVRGRMLVESDDVRGGSPQGVPAVVSERFWRQRFGGAEDVVSRRLSLNGAQVTIVGVMPASFFGPQVGSTVDVVVPIASVVAIDGNPSMLTNTLTWWLQVMMRLKPGQTIDDANVALRGVQPQIRAATLPDSYRSSLGEYLKDPLTLVPASDAQSSPLRTRYKEPLTIILVVVGAVLLIACANIASLLLARAVARRHELVVRLALGASRWRLARQLLLESGMLAATGAGLGVALAIVGSSLLIRQLATPMSPVSLDVSIDWRVLGFTAAVAVVTALVFGLAPALGVTNVSPNEVLREQTRSVTGDRRRSLRNGLVIVQIALSLALVAAAGLFVRTFTSLVSQPLGMTADSLMLVNVSVQRSQIPAGERLGLYNRISDAAAAVPGVSSTAWSSIGPLTGSGWNTAVEVDGAPPASDRERLSWLNAVTPTFFETYGIGLVGGRAFTGEDRSGDPLVAVVNQAFARKFFKGQNPVGRQFRRATPQGGTQPYQIVGLVTDAVYRRLREGMMPTIYVPLAQQVPLGPSLSLAVRAPHASRAWIVGPLTRALTDVDPGLSLTIRPLDTYIGAGVTQERLVAILSGFFGGLALLMAAIGLYGVTSYGVHRRRSEIGIRMALGADADRIVGLVLRRVGGLVAAGVAAGIALSWWVAKFISAALLFGVTPRDVTTLAGSAVVLILVGALAGWWPARRAASIDPTEVLRES